jgi:outer membrane protein
MAHMRSRLSCIRFGLSFWVAFSAPALYAQQPEYGAGNLIELFHLAEINSPSIASAKASLLATHEKARQAFGAFLPSVNYNGSKSKQNTQAITNEVIAPENDTAVTKHEIALTQPLYSRPSSIQYQISKHQIEKQEYELNQLTLDLRSKVAQAYFLILTYEDTLRLLNAQKSTFAQQLAQAKRSYELGITTVTDVHEAQSKLDSLIAQEIGTTKELEAAKISLRTLVGKNFKLTQTFQIEFGSKLKTIPDVNTLLEQAYASNYQIRSLNTLAELATLDIKKANAQHYPSLDLKASVSQSKQNVISTNTSQTDSRNTQVGVYLTIPLYSGGIISSKMREAVHNFNKVAYDIDNAKLSIKEDVEGNHTKWKLGIAQIEALDKAIVSSEAALKSVNTGYALGVRIGLDVFTAQQQVIQLKKDLLKAKYDTLMSALKIRVATGQNYIDLF